ncbi:GNAT family N-acetyltransferase [Knoellia sp. Soil729]|uniref:GNAT family N-acetyltransferase n=1 Tax=Knoellia sp. Soil729 TaxID=1736394 RepID=UPI0006FF8A40|nr:GNAT family N-acetyltransferase [Knoellia sp. Soil729]KRE43416.1 hypothetical protein ASG74_00755 [Knoellia sp. Soil729]
MDPSPLVIRRQSFAELDPVVAYRIWALRSEVFVVEQKAAYLDLDGRDLEPGTVHVWCAEKATDPGAVGSGEDPGVPVGTLRVLDDEDVWRVGRVVTAAPHRGRGVAAAMVREVLALCSDRPVVLDAQSHLKDWYAGFGFVGTGAEYADEDGIPHVPMRREAGPA